MSSITLQAQSFRPALPMAGGVAARGLTDATALLAALLRSITGAIARRFDRNPHPMTHVGAASELHERALAHLACNPSYAADLMAAAGQLDTVVERA